MAGEGRKERVGRKGEERGGWGGWRKNEFERIFSIVEKKSKFVNPHTDPHHLHTLSLCTHTHTLSPLYCLVVVS